MKTLIVFVLLYILALAIGLGFVVGYGRGYSKALVDVMRNFDVFEKESAEVYV